MGYNLKFSNAAPFRYYKSADAMLADIEQAAEALEAAGKPRKYHVATDKGENDLADWYQTETYEQATDYFRGGWSYGSQVLSEALGVISDGKDSGIFESACLENDVTGAVCDVGAFVTGDPECMLTVEAPKQENVVTICVNTVQPGSVSGEQMLWRGAAIIALIQALESRGHRTRLICFDIAPTRKRWAGWVLGLKEPGERLNINTIAYALANPSMMRRHSFRWAETVAYDWQVKDAEGYGAIAELSQVEGMGTLTDDIDFQVERFMGLGDSPEEAHENLMSHAREVGLIA